MIDKVPAMFSNLDLWSAAKIRACLLRVSALNVHVQDLNLGAIVRDDRVMNIEARSYRLLRRLSKVPPPNHSRLKFSRPVDSSLFPHVTFDAPCSSFSLVNRRRILIFKQLHFTKRGIDSEVVLSGYQRWLNAL